MITSVKPSIWRALLFLGRMRIDKFLWAVRKYKTRSLAADEIKKGAVKIGDEIVKPSREVKKGDEIEFRKDAVHYKVKVLDFPKSRVGAKLVEQYITDVTSQEELDKKEFIGLMRSMNRKKGMGRPTKKERRDLDDFQEWD